MLEKNCEIPAKTSSAMPLWLIAFVMLQVFLGLVFLAAAALRLFDVDRALYISVPIPIPPLSMGTLHLALAYSLWWQRRWFWIPNVLVLVVPVAWLIVDSVCGGMLVR